jgi:hypothetical protein
MEHFEELRGLEERLLHPAVRKNPAALRELLAEEFVEIGSSGTQYDRETIIAALEDEVPSQVELHDFRATLLVEDLVLVIYRTVRHEKRALKQARRSSIWMRREGRWQMCFHQGTKMSEESGRSVAAAN